MPKETYVKIIPRPKPKVPVWLNLLLWLSVIILVGVIFSLFYLQNQISSLKEKEKSLEVQIAQFGTKEQKDLEAEIESISSKIKDFADLLRGHKITSEFFELLKSSCHPKVQFTSLDLDAENNRINLTGRAEDFQVLGEQVLIFGESKDIEDIKVSNISLSKEGKVEFKLSFALSPEFFAQQTHK